jgi:hypothetical protein
VESYPAVGTSGAKVQGIAMTGAYDFVCQDRSTAELLSRLNALGGWSWRMGDSHWYGDYLACGPFAEVRIRICDFPERAENEFRYRADVRASGECKTPMETIDGAFRKVLEEIGARGVREIEWFD